MINPGQDVVQSPDFLRNSKSCILYTKISPNPVSSVFTLQKQFFFFLNTMVSQQKKKLGLNHSLLFINLNELPKTPSLPDVSGPSPAPLSAQIPLSH